MRGSHDIKQEIQLLCQAEETNRLMAIETDSIRLMHAPTQLCPVVASAVNAMQALSELSDKQ